MSELSPKAQALIDAGQESQQPAAGQAERTWAALQLRIAAAPAEPQEAPSLSPREPASSAEATALLTKPVNWGRIALGIGGGIILAAALFSQRQRAEMSTSQPPNTDSPAVESAAAQSPVPATLPPTDLNSGAAAFQNSAIPSASPQPLNSFAGPAQRAIAKQPTAQPAADRLAEEVALLSQAESDFNAGRTQAALRSLDQHARQFPGGVLRIERLAARARALCALGRRADAERDLQRLSRLAPDSPQQLRAKKACAAP